MKQITIAGNIGKDAELRSTPNGDKVAGFSVAVETRDRGEKGTQWFDVSIWGKRAEALASYLTKGSRVCVVGDLGTREYEGKTYLTLRADQITLMGGGKRDDAGHSGGYQPQGAAPAGGAPSYDDMNGDIPFAPW